MLTVFSNVYYVPVESGKEHPKTQGCQMTASGFTGGFPNDDDPTVRWAELPGYQNSDAARCVPVLA